MCENRSDQHRRHTEAAPGPPLWAAALHLLKSGPCTARVARAARWRGAERKLAHLVHARGRERGVKGVVKPHQLQKLLRTVGNDGTVRVSGGPAAGVRVSGGPAPGVRRARAGREAGGEREERGRRRLTAHVPRTSTRWRARAPPARCAAPGRVGRRAGSCARPRPCAQPGRAWLVRRTRRPAATPGPRPPPRGVPGASLGPSSCTNSPPLLGSLLWCRGAKCLSRANSNFRFLFFFAHEER